MGPKSAFYTIKKKQRNCRIKTSNEVSMQNDKISRKNLAETTFNSDTETELQCLEFASPLLSGDYRLVEVSPSLADRIIAGEQ
ncbi:unnamed protein product [Brugia pahangi]|uniref:Uncharacterized protein n=1 Tax=Brugia pahangi TaxID=6280 RepID=A0A0N4T8D1_BRUPA|nr:unnamed protein product [Brugia pahangi]